MCLSQRFGYQQINEVIMKTLSKVKKKSPPEAAKVLGRYIVSDPKICHGIHNSIKEVQ